MERPSLVSARDDRSVSIQEGRSDAARGKRNETSFRGASKDSIPDDRNNLTWDAREGSA